MASLHFSTRPVRKSRAHGSEAKSSDYDDDVGLRWGHKHLRARIKITTRHTDLVMKEVEQRVQQLFWSLESAVPTQPSERLLPFKFRSRVVAKLPTVCVSWPRKKGEREREKSVERCFRAQFTPPKKTSKKTVFRFCARAIPSPPAHMFFDGANSSSCETFQRGNFVNLSDNCTHIQSL